MIRLAFARGMEKAAVVGPALDAGTLFLPSLLGYTIASHMSQGEDPEELSRIASGNDLGRGDALARFLLLPGYLGWRAGKEDRAMSDLLNQRISEGLAQRLLPEVEE